MKSQLLKLDAPYSVIYAGGYVGRHIATLLTWKEDEEGEMVDTVSYPVIDMGEEYPGGKMVMTDLDDCRVLCPAEGTNLFWVAKIIEYDFQQVEPAGIYYILKRMRLLNCNIKMPTEKDKDGKEVMRIDFTATLDITPLKASWEEPQYYRVKSNCFEGFYFEAEGTAEEIEEDLMLQRTYYFNWFNDEISSIRFKSHDPELKAVINRLNEHASI